MKLRFPVRGFLGDSRWNAVCFLKIKNRKFPDRAKVSQRVFLAGMVQKPGKNGTGNQTSVRENLQFQRRLSGRGKPQFSRTIKPEPPHQPTAQGSPLLGQTEYQQPTVKGG